MKRLSTKILAFIIILGGISITAFANEVLLNGQTVNFGQKLDLEQGTLLAPIKPITDLTDLFDSEFRSDGKNVNIRYRNTGISAEIGSKWIIRRSRENPEELILLPVLPSINNYGVPCFPVEAIFRALLGDTGVYVDKATNTCHIMTLEYVPPTPLNLREVARGKDNIVLSWDSAGFGIKYWVYKNKQNDPNSAERIGSAPVSALNMVVPMNAGETYYYWVTSLHVQESGKASMNEPVTMPAKTAETAKTAVVFTLGGSIGVLIRSPTTVYGTVYGAMAPFRSSFFKNTFIENTFIENTFLKVGVNLGWKDNPDIPLYFSPFAQYNLCFAPFPQLEDEKKLKLYFGGGIGYLYENDHKFTLNLFANLIIGKGFTISYTPLWYNPFNDLPYHQLSVGYVHQFR